MKERLGTIMVWTLLALGVVGFGLGTYNTFGATQPHALGSFNPTGGGTYLLQSSISATQNTLTLTSFTEPSSGIPYTMSYINTDVIYGTISPSSGNSEFITATGITQNANGTATLTGLVRGLSRTPGTGGCVASTTLAHAYPGQTQFVLSNSPCFYSEYAVLKNNQIFQGINTFNISPIINDSSSTSTAQAASRLFVLNTAFQGAATSTENNMGIVQLATAAQTGVGTASSTTGTPLVIENKFATTTPGALCTGGTWHCLVASTNGKISQTWLDLTQAFAVSGVWTFNAGAVFNAAPTFGTFSATSTGNATSSISANLTIGGNASTTNLIISNNCTGCLSGWATSTTAVLFSLANGSSQDVTATCAAGKKVLGGGYESSVPCAPSSSDCMYVTNQRPLANNSYTVTFKCVTGSSCSTQRATTTAICANQ